jgi:Uma2 family endonuclease
MATATAPPAAAELRPHRFTTTDYFQMVAAGILTEDDRVELLGGQIVEMSPSNPPHAGTVDRCIRVFSRAVGDRALIRNQNPLDLEPYDAPEPDVALVRPRADEYTTSHPTAAAVLLVVEVSDSTLTTDRLVKRPLYAAAGLPEVWILNLQDDRLEVGREPRGDQYAAVRVYGPRERVAPLAFPELLIAVTDLLPPGVADREREREQATETRRPGERRRGPELER